MTAIPLKRLAEVNRGVLAEDTDPNFAFEYVDISAVTQGQVSSSTERLRFGDAPSRARRLAEPGDTVVSTVRTYLRAVAQVPARKAPLVFSTGFAVLHPRAGVDARFLGYALQSGDFIEEVVARSVGVSYPAIAPSELGAMKIRVPTLSVQRAVGEYLDAETAQIDALIAQQERFIQLLDERRAAVAVAVLDSVAPPARGARLKHHVTRVTQGWSPQCFATPADGIDTWAVLKAGAVNGGTFRPEQNKELPPEETPRPDLVVQPGQLIVSRANIRSLVGSAAVAEGHYPKLILSDKLYALTFDEQSVDSKYVALALGTPRWRDLIEMSATGTSHSMLNISQSDILNLPLDVPSIADQRALVEAVARQARAIDALRAETWEHIALAKERRNALITAAVAGQIDFARKVS